MSMLCHVALVALEGRLSLDALETSLLCRCVALLQLCSREGVLYLRVAAPRADVAGLRFLETLQSPLSNFTSTAVTADSLAVCARDLPLCICEVGDIQPLVACGALRDGCATFLKGCPINALATKLSQEKCCSLGAAFAMLDSLLWGVKEKIEFERT